MSAQPGDNVTARRLRVERARKALAPLKGQKVIEGTLGAVMALLWLEFPHVRMGDLTEIVEPFGGHVLCELMIMTLAVAASILPGADR